MKFRKLLWWVVPISLVAVAGWTLWSKRAILETSNASIFCLLGVLMLIGIVLAVSGVRDINRKGTR